MPKKRRKLNPEMEKQISEAKRKVELVTAIINDIDEESIQGEYIVAFEPVKICLTNLISLYTDYGYNDDSQKTLDLYKKLVNEFESEYEV